MVHGCRVCLETLESGNTDSSTVLMDIALLKTEVEQLESDLLDSFPPADASPCPYQWMGQQMLKPATYGFRSSASVCFRLTA